ncbi:MAG: hypothetical protein ACR2GI_03870, partial [Thermomicrobiales bacterium]
ALVDSPPTVTLTKEESPGEAGPRQRTLFGIPIRRRLRRRVLRRIQRGRILPLRVRLTPRCGRNW